MSGRKLERAICIHCGKWKREPPVRCELCGFTPTTDAEKSKSIILSLDYEIENEYLGKSVEQLDSIGLAIGAGRAFKFNDDEVDHLSLIAREGLNVPARRLWIDGLRWIAPVLIVMGVLVFLWFKG